MPGHAPPPARLRELLQTERAAGADFDGAWERSIALTLRGASGGEEVDDWRAVLEWSRHAWRRAYAQAPPALLDQALAACAPDGEPALDEPLPDGQLTTPERDQLVWEQFHGVRSEVVAQQAPCLGSSARTIERARVAEAARRGVRVRPKTGELTA